MSATPGGKRFLDDFKEFISFMQSLWGLLAGISVLFPLSNAFFKIIPLELVTKPLIFIPPGLITTVTTLVSLFIVLSTFGERNEMAGKSDLVRRKAWVSFSIGLAALVLYVVGFVLVVNIDIFGQWKEAIGQSALWLSSDIIFWIEYTAFFVLTTRAFELLAMSEYFRDK
jgi:uncharacterized membrane protein